MVSRIRRWVHRLLFGAYSEPAWRMGTARVVPDTHGGHWLVTREPHGWSIQQYRDWDTDARAVGSVACRHRFSRFTANELPRCEHCGVEWTSGPPLVTQIPRRSSPE